MKLRHTNDAINMDNSFLKMFPTKTTSYFIVKLLMSLYEENISCCQVQDLLQYVYNAVIHLIVILINNLNICNTKYSL
jgi:hypothetical protein